MNDRIKFIEAKLRTTACSGKIVASRAKRVLNSWVSASHSSPLPAECPSRTSSGNDDLATLIALPTCVNSDFALEAYAGHRTKEPLRNFTRIKLLGVPSEADGSII